MPTAKNKVTFGLKNVHIAFFDTDNATQPAWEAPIAIPGAVRITPTPVGEESTFYADDGAYYVTTSNNGYTQEWEAALIPDEVLVRMLGWKIDANGAVVEVSDGQPEKFALMGQVTGDARNRRFVYYNNQASRPGKEKSTKAESIEVKTDVLSLNTSPMEIGGRTMVQSVLELNDTNATAYNAFFTAVYKPSFAEGDVV